MALGQKQRFRCFPEGGPDLPVMDQAGIKMPLAGIMRFCVMVFGHERTPVWGTTIKWPPFYSWQAGLP